MKEYKRLTKRDEFGNADIIGLSTEKLYSELCFDETNLLTKALNRLARLEDKIENGTLIELPCKVGTTIYHLYKAGNVITEDKVFNYHFEICSKPRVSFENYFWFNTDKRVDTILVEHFGKWWFLTKAEAEAKLKELQNERD